MQRNGFSTGEAADLNEIIDHFESTWSPTSDLNDFLPDSGVANFAEIFCELVRVDLEFRWTRGETPEARDYLNRFPETALTREELGEIVFEEFRLRNQFGMPLNAEHFSTNYGIDVSNWPRWQADGHDRREPGSAVGHRVTIARFPDVGEQFHDFELVGLLGQGAFGRVYLARQSDLANRFVALKVTEVNDGEPHALARLQHTNIVPIHSLRRDGQLQSLCMPFLGLVTLRDLVHLADNSDVKSLGKSLISTVAGKRASTVALNKTPRIEASELDSILLMESPSKPSIIDRMNYQDMILWMMGRVADGLAYSHSRGIVHGDMKPGNILITDDGQPLILDFHLATQRKFSEHNSLVGGTLPYMSARQLGALVGNEQVDESCDLFSVGVILFEAVTGSFPYPARSHDDSGIHQMIRDRQDSPPPVRKLNPTVSAGTASIIEHCISPSGGYESAEQLRSDIDRHLANLPLKHAPNRSASERLSKWTKRHPRVTSMSAMVMIGLLLAALAAILIGAKLNRAARIEASQRSHEFIDQINLASQPLMLGTHQSIDLHQQNLELSALLASRTGDANEFASSLSELTATDRKQQELAVIDASYWLARSMFTEALKCDSDSQRQEILAKANNQLESAMRAANSSPKALVQLQVDMLEARGELEKAKQLRLRLDQLSTDKTAGLSDQLLQAAEYRRTNQESKALELLQRLAIEHVNAFPVWLMMGHSYLNLNQLSNAEASYTVCIGLDNRSQWGFFSRGIARLENRDFEGAKSDFDRAIERDDSVSASYLNRALAFQGMHQLTEAVEDLTMAINKGCLETRARYIRHQLFKQLGQPELAQADLEKFLELVPNDEKSWLSRGMAQIQIGKPERALADFQSALKINPRSTNAFQNIATVQAQFLGQTQAAIDALTAVIDEAPGNDVAIATRGVLHARIANREQALADAQRALKESRSADTMYRVAGIFALLSKSNERDATTAVDLLEKAAFANGQLVLSRIKEDPDLDEIRDNDNFKRMIETLEKWSKLPKPG
jgi:serine/threonine protein kinase/tetratricopeptide (TPR) repeat protein